MSIDRQYTTQLQAGLGMVAETLGLLALWLPGDSPAKLSEKAIESGLFSRTTARRARNLVAEMFAPRFLVQNGLPAKRLKFLVDCKFPSDSLRQLFFLYTARAQAIFHDFVSEVYWSRYSARATALRRDDAERFIYRALDTGHMQKRWTDSTIRRISAYLVGCCGDFGLLGERNQAGRAITHFAIRPDVAVYLAHDLHFSGLGDMALASHADWRLFGLEPHEALNQIKLMAHNGHFLVQAVSDLVQVSWKYRTMEDCLNALVKR
jgi:hypothetical protein